MPHSAHSFASSSLSHASQVDWPVFSASFSLWDAVSSPHCCTRVCAHLSVCVLATPSKVFLASCWPISSSPLCLLLRWPPHPRLGAVLYILLFPYLVSFSSGSSCYCRSADVVIPTHARAHLPPPAPPPPPPSLSLPPSLRLLCSDSSPFLPRILHLFLFSGLSVAVGVRVVVVMCVCVLLGCCSLPFVFFIASCLSACVSSTFLVGKRIAHVRVSRCAWMRVQHFLFFFLPPPPLVLPAQLLNCNTKWHDGENHKKEGRAVDCNV